MLPLNDLGFVAFRQLEYKVAPPASGKYVYYPGTTEVPEASAARTLGSSFKILAEVEFTGDSQGIIFVQGSRFGGYAMFVKGGKLTFVYNFLGIPPEQRLSGDAPKLGKHIVGVEFVKDKDTREPSEEIRNSIETLGFEHGLLLLGCGKSTIRLAPPLCITRQEVDEGIEIFESAITQAEREHGLR